jgi:hypothetical protein
MRSVRHCWKRRRDVHRIICVSQSVVIGDWIRLVRMEVSALFIVMKNKSKKVKKRVMMIEGMIILCSRKSLKFLKNNKYLIRR